MAAPASKTLRDFNGKWALNKTLSDAIEPVLVLQGVSWFLRKTVGMASITLHVQQFEAAPLPPSEAKEPVLHIVVDQTGTGGIKGSTEKRCVDWVFREHSDWLFGRVQGRTKWIATADIDHDAFLRSNWLEGQEEASGPAGETHLMSYVESLDNGWIAVQIWGFQIIEGVRRYARNIVVSKGEEKVKVRLVYDYLGDE